MLLMGVVIILYEYKRNNKYSLIVISILLISIYSLIYFSEGHLYHYIYFHVSFCFYNIFYVSNVYFIL